jgi:hypothetical protein
VGASRVCRRLDRPPHSHQFGPDLAEPGLPVQPISVPKKAVIGRGSRLIQMLASSQMLSKVLPPGRWLK